MKIVIIGGSGFIGSVLIEKLNDFSNLLNFDKNGSHIFPEKTIIGNICNVKDFKNILKNTSTVVLLAAEHKDNVYPKSLYYDVNVKGTENVLREMDKHKVKNLIFTSSVAVYGLNKNNPSERHELDPFNDYGKSKLMAEESIYKWFKNNPLEKSVTIIRPTVVFGKKNRGNVYKLLNQISSGIFVIIGNGNNIKSMAYVENVALFIKNRIKEKTLGYEIFNYSDKPDLNMNDLVKIISEYLGIKIPRIRIPYFIGLIIGYFFDFLTFLTKKTFLVSSVRIKKICATTQYDSKKLKGIFLPPYNLIEGLKKTIEFEFKREG